MNDSRNLILAIALSLAVLIAWHLLYERPRLEAEMQRMEAAKAARGETGTVTPAVAANPGQPKLRTHSEALAVTAKERVRIDSPLLKGSISLVGARLDDLTLKGYHETPDPTSPEVVLFSPAGTEQVYFTETGWLAAEGGKVTLPDSETLWQADRRELTPTQPLTLKWTSPEGVRFSIRIALDEKYMFTLDRQVENASGQRIALSSYGLISRMRPEAQHFFILQEGPQMVAEGKLVEEPYHKLKEDGSVTAQSEGGWLGITDKYWLSAIVPAGGFTGNFTYYSDNARDRYQVDWVAPAVSLASGETQTETLHLFAGAKKLALLEQYQEQYNIPLFERAIDFGWFYFLTKPMFYALNWLNSHIHHFGIALLVLTVIIKLLMFPLASKSYKSMSQMKHLGPKMQALKERYADDKVKMNQAVMEMYKKEKINPLSGCLPMVLQIPVFFSLYKVLFITIEMRHAPFFGWIRDLSAPDPTNILNLFGLLPFAAPSFVHIGAWPIIMGITMLLQQRMNPTPPDPVQARVIKMMPFVLIFVFASFPAGLVIYWSWSNVLSILQQWVIMRGVERAAKKKEQKHAVISRKEKKSK